MRHIAGFALLILVTTSCVTNKKFQLLQKNDVNKQHMPSDTVVRQYNIDGFDYRVQTNDVLSVRFESITPKEYDFLARAADPMLGNAAFIGGAQLLGDLVDEKGEIPFPVVGKVKVAGMTVFEIQEHLQDIAKQYLDSPVVKVRLLNYRLTLLGEVNREGVVMLNNNRVTMLEAIGLGGGMTDLADKTSVKLIRQVGNQTKVIYLDLLDENFINSPYYYVYQNDVLIVPALKQRPFRKYFGPNISLVISSISLLLLVVNLSR
ncbi:MAG: polysaccharide export protein [Bacteroidetes bacterium]|nr:polysaccharide export protein [Bacteroidota bacterium]